VSQRTHTQTFTEGINQRLSPERTRGFVRLQNARLSAIGNTAEVKRIQGYESLQTGLTSGTLLDSVVFGDYVILLFANGINHVIEVRHLTNSGSLVGSVFTFSHDGDEASLVLSNNTIFVAQANKMLNYLGGTFYLNNIRPESVQVEAIAKRINLADEDVDPASNVIKSPVISFVTMEGSELYKTIEYNIFDDNRAEGRTGSLNYTVKLLTNIIGLEEQTQSFTYVATPTSGATSGTFNLTLPSQNTSYKCELVVYLDSYPQYNYSKKFTVSGKKNPDISVWARVDRDFPPVLEPNPKQATVYVDLEGVIYNGTTVDITFTTYTSAARNEQVDTQSFTNVATNERIGKIKVGGDPSLLGRVFNQTYSFQRPWAYNFNDDYVVDVSFNVSGQSGEEYEASDSITVVIPPQVPPGTSELTVKTPV
jgi:hypothetical protein